MKTWTFVLDKKKNGTRIDHKVWLTMRRIDLKKIFYLKVQNIHTDPLNKTTCHLITSAKRQKRHTRNLLLTIIHGRPEQRSFLGANQTFSKLLLHFEHILLFVTFKNRYTGNKLSNILSQFLLAHLYFSSSYFISSLKWQNSHPTTFTGVANAHGLLSESTACRSPACRSPACSLMPATGSNQA